MAHNPTDTAASRGGPSSRTWRRLILVSFALFAFTWLLLGGWYGGRGIFRFWTLVTLPLWSTHRWFTRAECRREIVVAVLVLLVWGILAWFTGCSYPSPTGEECYVTRAEKLLWYHAWGVPVTYAAFPILVTIDMLLRRVPARLPNDR